MRRMCLNFSLLVILLGLGSIVISGDGGNTWANQTNPFGVWAGASSSNDGKNLVAVQQYSDGGFGTLGERSSISSSSDSSMDNIKKRRSIRGMLGLGA